MPADAADVDLLCDLSEKLATIHDRLKEYLTQDERHEYRDITNMTRTIIERIRRNHNGE